MGRLTEPKLKACPFCAGEARYGRGGDVWDDARLWAAGCVFGHAQSPEMDTIEQAAEWWNRRDKPGRSALAASPDTKGMER